MVVIDVATQEAEEVLEAVCLRTDLRRAAQVPLADQPGGVTVLLQRLRQRSAGHLQAAGAVAAQGSFDYIALLVTPADETCPRRAAQDAVGVEVGQPDAGLADAVDVWGLDSVAP